MTEPPTDPSPDPDPDLVQLGKDAKARPATRRSGHVAARLAADPGATLACTPDPNAGEGGDDAADYLAP